MTEVDKRYEEEVEEELLEKEAQATRKRKAKSAGQRADGEPDWVVPDAETAAPREKAAKKAEKAAASSAKEEERTKQRLAREKEKQEKMNAGIAAFAGKSLSMLHPKLEGLKAVQKLCGGKQEYAELEKEVDEAATKITTWIQHGRAVVSAHAACPSAKLDPLPFDASSLKATVTASGELGRWVRSKIREEKKACAPQAKSKAKAKAADGSSQGRRRCTGKRPEVAAQAEAASDAAMGEGALSTQPYP